MTSSYKPIGQFIRQVKARNKDFVHDEPKGININKVFMPSVANTTGTDLSKYRVVSKYQFAYNPMHVGRDGVLPIAMLDQDEDVIVSPAYVVFEIRNQDELLPEYLMMWCRRPEFDRNAWFTTDSSVRGGFNWDDLCVMQLPVPDIDVQREIVREYNVIVDRIKLNEQLCTKLEETAQALYRHWFVDFEFPISADYAASIGKPELEGKPYKSNGGKMKYCPDTEKDIPVAWDTVRLDRLATLSAGGDKPAIFSDFKTGELTVPVFANGVTDKGLVGYTNKAKVFDPCITVSARGGIGFTALRNEAFVPIVRLIVVKPKEEFYLNYLFQSIRRFKFQDGTSSAQSQLTVPDFSTFDILKPEGYILSHFQEATNKVHAGSDAHNHSIGMLQELSQVLKSRMTRAA